MMEYFTPERIADLLLHCEQEGITTFQSSYSARIREGLLRARDRGSRIQWICLASALRQVVGEVMPLKPMAVVHHGNVTDALFRANKVQKVRDFLDAVHDLGVPAGISTHNPAHLERIEELGWPADFYMACFYDVLRPGDEIAEALGGKPVGELFLDSDPRRMTQSIRKVPKPCLAFKILAAGRLCWTAEMVEHAFAYAFANIKKTDAVIVGMYPVFSNEVEEDCELTRKYGQPGTT